MIVSPYYKVDQGHCVQSTQPAAAVPHFDTLYIYTGNIPTLYSTPIKQWCSSHVGGIVLSDWVVGNLPSLTPGLVGQCFVIILFVVKVKDMHRYQYVYFQHLALTKMLKIKVIVHCVPLVHSVLMVHCFPQCCFLFLLCYVCYNLLLNLVHIAQSVFTLVYSWVNKCEL